MAYSGRYHLENPQKYIGNPENVVYRSLWERRVMYYLDTNVNVLNWASEEIFIPYISPKDGHTHRYFPDFFVKAKKKDGNVTEMLWEVKPDKQTRPPSKVKDGKRKSPKRRHRYIVEAVTYGINLAKWEAAKKFCAEHGWEFRVLTEKDLGIFPHYPHK